jgi:site-specific recombinase XerD
MQKLIYHTKQKECGVVGNVGSRVLELSKQPENREGYRFGLNKFVEWFGKPPEQVLALRQEDLTQKPGENLVEYRNRAARFEKQIEKFHSYLIEKGYSINSARNMTLGIRQLFRYYQMPVVMRSGSRVSQTVQTTKNFPLTIEHVRKMFEVANLKERTILSVAVDTGLRISDFLTIKKTDLPPLDKEPPIGFELLTQKEKIPAHCFLSQESVDLLKTYLPTLRKKNNVHLFASNGKSHISDEAISKMLKRLAERAQIDLNGKRLSFHCFRKIFLSASIDSGIGLTAGKLLCGKAVAKSDATYLTTVKLREKFIQLKRFLSISEQPRIEAEKLESLKKAVSKLQEELIVQKTIAEAVSEENLKLKADMEALSKGQGVLEKRMDEMTTLFQETFTDLVKESAETIDAYAEKLKQKRDRKTRKNQTKPRK